MDEHPEIDVEWTGFQLRPDTPVGGERPFAMYPPAYFEAKKAQFAEFAKSWGVEGFSPPELMPNTLRVLAMAEHARDEGKLRPFREAVMDAYWYRGANLEDEATLKSLAAGAGLDPETAWAASGSEALQGRVNANRAEANAMGISAVPTYIFVEGEAGLAVVGCQPYETLAQAMEQLAKRAR